MEELRSLPFADLDPGGSLTESVPDFADVIDLDADGSPDFVRRWSIEAGDGSATIRVTTMSMQDTIGPRRGTTLVALVAER
jgi:hypothetical protein